ncbi:MAG: hypothetical protein JSV42_09100 [Chloroflexota bacterium]|nr:MAG: hypothetical protein JSV42_09100 [Chloroflexota bacterium]
MANNTLKIGSCYLNSALLVLEELGKEAVIIFPNLLEPWQIIRESGVMGQETELTLMAKAEFGKVSELCPRLLALVQDRFLEEQIKLVGKEKFL